MSDKPEWAEGEARHSATEWFHQQADGSEQMSLTEKFEGLVRIAPGEWRQWGAWGRRSGARG